MAPPLHRLLPQLVGYKLAHLGWAEPKQPLTLTFSVTNRCQSRCLSCNIWEFYRDKNNRLGEELTIDEVSTIFAKLGPVYFFNISGGEPMLRRDLPEIVTAAVEHLRPRILHCPTNALQPQRVHDHARAILELLRRRDPTAQFTLKPSLDGIGEQHDKIRGIPGNFAKVMRTLELLGPLRQEFPNFHLELGTVISKLNVHDVDRIAAFIHGLGVESYRSEIAEERVEFDNLGSGITPEPEEYEVAIRAFARHTRHHLSGKRPLTRLLESFRLAYYDFAIAWVRSRQQVLPCYAGITNVHLSPYGDLWPCCTLADSQSMGNLRDFDYDFHRVWRSTRARQVRGYIKDKNCACPLANQAYSTMLMSPRYLLKIVRNALTHRAIA